MVFPGSGERDPSDKGYMNIMWKQWIHLIRENFKAPSDVFYLQ